MVLSRGTKLVWLTGHPYCVQGGHHHHPTVLQMGVNTPLRKPAPLSPSTVDKGWGCYHHLLVNKGGHSHHHPLLLRSRPYPACFKHYCRPPPHITTTKTHLRHLQHLSLSLSHSVHFHCTVKQTHTNSLSILLLPTITRGSGGMLPRGPLCVVVFLPCPPERGNFSTLLFLSPPQQRQKASVVVVSLLLPKQSYYCLCIVRDGRGSFVLSTPAPPPLYWRRNVWCSPRPHQDTQYSSWLLLSTTTDTLYWLPHNTTLTHSNIINGRLTFGYITISLCKWGSCQSKDIST